MKNCINCEGFIIKYGKTTLGKQRFRCKSCRKTFLTSYTYQACLHTTNYDIVRYLKEGIGIRSTARLLGVSPTTVLKRIVLISKTIVKPTISIGKTYEVDEIRTFIKTKCQLYWIVYALRRDNGHVVDFAVGKRNNTTLFKVLSTLLLSAPLTINTDKLPNYTYLLPEDIHKTIPHGTNRIERKNLTIRTHLKRLNRRTICYSKSEEILSACMKIYFWG